MRYAVTMSILVGVYVLRLARIGAEVLVVTVALWAALLAAKTCCMPGDAPERDTTLAADELVIAVELPPDPFARHSCYLKLRDRRSYAFALVSAACALDIAQGRIRSARIALGGVAHKPWRRCEAEALLAGQVPGVAAFEAAAAVLVEGARALEHNGFKIELARRAVVRALLQAAGMEAGA